MTVQQPQVTLAGIQPQVAEVQRPVAKMTSETQTAPQKTLPKAQESLPKAVKEFAVQTVEQAPVAVDQKTTNEATVAEKATPVKAKAEDGSNEQYTSPSFYKTFDIPDFDLENEQAQMEAVHLHNDRVVNELDQVHPADAFRQRNSLAVKALPHTLQRDVMSEDLNRKHYQFHSIAAHLDKRQLKQKVARANSFKFHEEHTLDKIKNEILAVMPRSIHGGSEHHYLNVQSQIPQLHDPEQAQLTQAVGHALQEEINENHQTLTAALSSSQALDKLSAKILERIRKSEYDQTQANTNAPDSAYHLNLLDQNLQALE